ncbi:MAG TPA: hypothetical protein VNU84_04065 [Candidatus Acidoferrum sp.]|jgi:hypothetical protein|nr:hypothetical protein [Candidatus Acidoferrum sp.]
MAGQNVVGTREIVRYFAEHNPAQDVQPGQAILSGSGVVHSSPKRSYAFEERRRSTRYTVGLRMEIWPESAERSPDPTFVLTRDISMGGVYFLSEIRRNINSKMNFAVMFLREFTGEGSDLITGIARVVRCDLLRSVPYTPFGIALAIEQTRHLEEG